MWAMSCDAHAHPFDLAERFPGAEDERRRLGVVCAASAWNRREFLAQEALARAAAASRGPAIFLCFGVHPQLPAAPQQGDSADLADSWNTLEELVAGKRLAAVGEAGFDLFDSRFKTTEALQDELFDRQLDLALAAGLPMVLHVRRGMHKVFARSSRLAKLPGVVLHSYSGTLREAEDLLKRGVDACFSFGTTLLLNHRRAMEACARLPAERILFETDAPYQPLRGKAYSSWEDLSLVIAAAVLVRAAAGSEAAEKGELDFISERNFYRVFGRRGPW